MAVIQYILANNLTSTYQSGLLRTRSYDRHLLDYLNDITLKRGDELHISVLSVDFKKAFGKVSHEILKLFGIGNSLHSCFTAILTEHKPIVKYDDFLLSTKQILGSSYLQL